MMMTIRSVAYNILILNVSIINHLLLVKDIVAKLNTNNE